MSSSSIDKAALAHLAKLARIAIDPAEEETLLADLDNMLEHFKVLAELDTKDVPPMAGGTDLMNVLREDGARENTDRGDGVEAFPASKDGYLKVPSVFDR
jgi:aspartyl-tRNA(Asn)/glutamyl-tRNA(Gln) amidotransferase subunit C